MVAWKKYNTYADASIAEKCLYVFKKGHRYLYVGKAKKFGGKSGRYAHGYGYLVDALLESGAKLHIATLNKKQWHAVRHYENTLISSAKGKLAVNKRRIKTFDSVKGLKGP
jgi:hypothetical protein